MKLALLTSLISLMGFSQMSTTDLSLLSSILEVESKPHFTYVNEDLSLKTIESRIKGTHYSDHNSHNILILTNDEIGEIINQSKLNSHIVFPDNLFPGSVAISKDSVANYIKSKNKKWFDDFDRLKKETTDTVKINEFLLKRPRPQFVTSEVCVHFFSKPIFIRNNTIALVYSGVIPRSFEIYPKVAFYKKVGDKWVYFVSAN